MHNHSYYVIYVNRPGYGRKNIATLHSEIVYVRPFVRLTFNLETVCASKLCTCVYTYNTITFFSVKFIVWGIVGYVCLDNFSIQGSVWKISSVNYYYSQLPSPMRQALQVSRYIFNIKHISQSSTWHISTLRVVRHAPRRLFTTENIVFIVTPTYCKIRLLF